MERVYFDYNASCPLTAEVKAKIISLLNKDFGNPATSHWAGAPARQHVEDARVSVAHAINAHPDEIVFTSGATESNNAVIKGIWFSPERRGVHFVTSAVEHPAIAEPLRFVERLGARVTRVPVDAFGQVSADAVQRALCADTVLVSIMHANNEIGTVNPIADIAAVCRALGVPLHTDAGQSLGTIEVDVARLGVDFLTVAGHKIGAPKGVGALYVRRGRVLEPLVHGAGHEAGRRAGARRGVRGWVGRV
jgi:cysteine desulfurase